MSTTRLPVWLAAPPALLAFAGNSLLARAVLSDPGNTPGAFAAVRLVAGAILLVGLGAAGDHGPLPHRRDAPTVIALFVYALGFAMAYASIGAASGALILFAAVQVTILGMGFLRGDRIGPVHAMGLALALSGLVWLLFPGLAAPPALAALLMGCAGCGWGLYSTINSSDGAPAERTTRNFTGAAVLALAALCFLPFRLTPVGWSLAIVSGAVTSALGYVLWYALLPHITRLTASSLQLLVPPITAVGGAALLGEGLSLRLAGSTLLIIGGVALTLRR